jgi:hypothetical protein
MVQGTIKTGKNTKGHGAWLLAHGYTVVEQVDSIVVEGTEFVKELDLSGVDALDVLKKVIEDKQLLTYQTLVSLKDGKRLFGIPLCGKLGTASALVVKPVKAEKAKATNEFSSL